MTDERTGCLVAEAESTPLTRLHPAQRHTTVLALQRAHGNLAVARLLHGDAGARGAQGPTSVQRDGDAGSSPSTLRMRDPLDELKVRLEDAGRGPTSPFVGEGYGMPKGHHGTGQLAELASGTIHPILASLEGCGWLESRWEDVDPKREGRPRRRYYRLTPDGVAYAARALSRVTTPAPLLQRLRPGPAAGGAV